MFNLQSSGQFFIAWYIVIVMEALAVSFGSSQWPGVSFQHTNLSERCGLLTLIILGEGIIVLSKSMNYVVQGQNFSSGIIAQIVSAVLIIVSLLAFHVFRPTPSRPYTNRPHQASLFAGCCTYTDRDSTLSTCSISTPAPNTLHPQPSTISGPSPTSPSRPPSSS